LYFIFNRFKNNSTHLPGLLSSNRQVANPQHHTCLKGFPIKSTG